MAEIFKDGIGIVITGQFTTIQFTALILKVAKITSTDWKETTTSIILEPIPQLMAEPAEIISTRPELLPTTKFTAASTKILFSRVETILKFMVNRAMIHS